MDYDESDKQFMRKHQMKAREHGCVMGRPTQNAKSEHADNVYMRAA